MTNVYAWSPDADSNDTIDPPIFWAEGQSPATVNNSARSMMAAIACWLQNTSGAASLAGTNSYTVSLSQSIVDYNKNFTISFMVQNENTQASTLSINGLASRPIVRRYGRQIGPGDLTTGVVYRSTFVASLGVFVITSPEIAAPGTILPQAGPDPDPGWLPCDGRAVSRAAYAALRARIGDRYGAGDGSTTFNVPDLRGRAPFGVDAGAGRLTTAGGVGPNAGDVGGFEAIVLTTDQMPSHSHTGQAQAGGATDTGTTGPSGDHNHGGQTATAGGHSHGVTIDQGGSHSHSGTANTAGGEARAFSFASGSLTAGGQSPYVADINAGNVFENKRVTSNDPGHVHSVTIPQSGDHTHTGSVSQAGEHQHGIPGSGTHTHTLPAAAAHTHPLAIDPAGGGAPHSNMPPALVVQFVIKT